MSEQHSIEDASRHLEELVRKAEQGEEVEITREGEAVAVLVGRRERERVNGTSQEPRKSPWEAYQEWRRTADFDAIGDPDEVWGNVRARGAGQDPRL